jgi:hypothetical protein
VPLLVRMGEGTIISAGCDWITGVAKQEHSSCLLSLWAAEVFRHQKSLGNLERPWGMAGFSGFACGQIQIGVREDEYICRLSSELAQQNWHELYKRCDGVTRFDVQVTHVNTFEARNRIRAHYRQALHFSAKQKRGPYVTLITGNDGSDTLYLGRRTSDQYGRIYNKGVESGVPAYHNAVRFEVEFKNQLAVSVARQMSSYAGHAPYAVARTNAFLEVRGLSSPFLGVPLSPIGVSSSHTDLEQKLDWLSKSCSKSIHAILEHGMGQQLLDALGVEIFNGELRRKLVHGPVNEYIN